MYLKKTPKYPIRKWLGKYSAYLAQVHTAKVWEQEEAHIERFLRCFPHYRSLEHFTSSDFADYCILHPRALMTPIRRFWWYLKEMGLPLHQIAIQCYVPKTRTTYHLSLSQMLSLFNECTSPELKRKIINAVKGGTSHIPPRLGGLRQELRDAATRIGLPTSFRLHQLKTAVRGRMERDIVETYCQQLLDTLPPETEFVRNPLRTIQVSAAHKGSSVSDSHDYLLPGSGINQQ